MIYYHIESIRDNTYAISFNGNIIYSKGSIDDKTSNILIGVFMMLVGSVTNYMALYKFITFIPDSDLIKKILTTKVKNKINKIYPIISNIVDFILSDREIIDQSILQSIFKDKYVQIQKYLKSGIQKGGIKHNDKNYFIHIYHNHKEKIYYYQKTYQIN